MQSIANSWRRFWSLPWRLKGPALVAVAAVPIAVAAVVLAVGGSDEVGESTAIRAGPSPTRALTPTAAPTATEPAPPTPADQGYRLVRAIEAADFDQMLGFSMIPGASDQAVVLT